MPSVTAQCRRLLLCWKPQVAARFRKSTFLFPLNLTAAVSCFTSCMLAVCLNVLTAVGSGSGGTHWPQQQPEKLEKLGNSWDFSAAELQHSVWTVCVVNFFFCNSRKIASTPWLNSFPAWKIFVEKDDYIIQFSTPWCQHFYWPQKQKLATELLELFKLLKLAAAVIESVTPQMPAHSSAPF